MTRQVRAVEALEERAFEPGAIDERSGKSMPKIVSAARARATASEDHRGSDDVNEVKGWVGGPKIAFVVLCSCGDIARPQSPRV
jgi:hypothetical protein